MRNVISSGQLRGVVVVVGCLLVVACDDEGSGNPAAGFETAFSGLTDEDYSYVSSSGTGLVFPPPASSDTATVIANEDYTTITVDTGSCTAVGNLASVRESDGLHFYEVAPESVSCTLFANGERAVLSDLGGAIRWNTNSLNVFISGEATISLGTSLFIIEFESF